MAQTIHLVGFGSQGAAWAHILQNAGWKTNIYLANKNSESFKNALHAHFQPKLISELPKSLTKQPSSPHLIALLCPDAIIGSVYFEMLAPLSEIPLTLVLAHGYAIYAKDLELKNPNHAVALLAPKAIGPRLQALGLKALAEGRPHELVAAFCSPSARQAQVLALAHALGFDSKNLSETSFELETIGDLISEQALLCGGLFSLIEWTVQEMQKAGVPSRLIQEECFSELELIAGLLKERGLTDTFKAISQVAQFGATQMKNKLKECKVPEAIAKQAQDIVSGKFANSFKRKK